MLIGPDAIIAEDKLTRYLLVRRAWDDKSGYLAKAGFTLGNWQELESAIRSLAESVEATEDGTNEYGQFFRQEGQLAGPAGAIPVVLIWMRRKVDQKLYFVTLKPPRR